MTTFRFEVNGSVYFVEAETRYEAAKKLREMLNS